MRGILQAVVQIFVVSLVQGENRQRIFGQKATPYQIDPSGPHEAA
jgi:hypothetical protein